MQILRDLFRYVPRSEPFAVTAEAQQQTLNAAVVSAFSKHQPKGDTARKTSTMDIPTLNEQKTKPVKEDATVILAKARQHMLDRAATYDKPEGERSMLQTVKVFNAYTGRDLSESDGWLFMDVLKTVRDLTGEKPHRDSLEDKVAYGSLYAESRLSGVAQVAPVAKKQCEHTLVLNLGNDTWLTYNSEKPLSVLGDLHIKDGMYQTMLEVTAAVAERYGPNTYKTVLKYAAGCEMAKDIPIERIQTTYDAMKLVLSLPRGAA